MLSLSGSRPRADTNCQPCPAVRAERGSQNAHLDEARVEFDGLGGISDREAVCFRLDICLYGPRCLVSHATKRRVGKAVGVVRT
jgi:hypothetical protein